MPVIPARRVSKPGRKSADIENFRWHDLRHTLASGPAMAGENLKTIKELPGHNSIAITLR
jgi:site-specific recombinase XerC